MKPTRLILIPALAGEPAPYLVIGAGGYVLERGVLALDAVERPEPMRTVAVAPGADVLIRWLDLPPGSAAQQRAAALWTLKDDLAAPADRLSVALGPVPVAGEPRLVAVVSQSLLDAWSDYLAALGVRADALVPDVLTLDEPFEDTLTAVALAARSPFVVDGSRPRCSRIWWISSLPGEASSRSMTPRLWSGHWCRPRLRRPSTSRRRGPARRPKAAGAGGGRPRWPAPFWSRRWF